jgi:thiol-disulfide isomerase/thioredoxin
MDKNPKTTGELLNTIKNTKCLIIKFSASWCGPCKNKTFLENYYNVKNTYNDNLDVKFLDFDVDKNKNFVEDEKLKFNITSVPTFLIYGNNKLLNQYNGTNCLDKIDADIKIILENL